jgi:hypothetical protein
MVFDPKAIPNVFIYTYTHIDIQIYELPVAMSISKAKLCTYLFNLDQVFHHVLTSSNLDNLFLSLSKNVYSFRPFLLILVLK